MGYRSSSSQNENEARPWLWVGRYLWQKRSAGWTVYFRQVRGPGYLKMRNKLEEYGINILGIDTDGMIEPLVSNGMEVRVNLQFPVEYGIWQATPEYMRKRFGRELLIVGGYDN